jgi:hypothetical protein
MSTLIAITYQDLAVAEDALKELLKLVEALSKAQTTTNG